MKRFAPVLGSFLIAACATHPTADSPDFAAQVQPTLDAFVADDPGVKSLVDAAHGYAVFPSVGKGGFVVGAAAGSGYVYERGQLIGTATIHTVSVGAQIGGHGFSELILFEDQATLDDFRDGEFDFSAAVDASAGERGFSKQTTFENGVAVLTRTKGGLMAEASVGGQRFSFRAVDDA